MTEGTTITETKEGVTVSVELKRGSGTRDQDKVYAKAHYPDLERAKEAKAGLVALCEYHARQARIIQPVQPEDSDD
jgi:hypothetical protein